MSRKLEQLSHYGIVVIALSAVVVSIWQVRILQDHNKLSVKPLMDFIIYSKNNESLEVKISNRGIGPAIIDGITYSFGGKDYQDWEGVLVAAGIKENVTSRLGYSPGTVLSPDSELLILKLTKEDYKSIGIGVNIVYKSIYEDKFTMKFSF